MGWQTCTTKCNIYCVCGDFQDLTGQKPKQLGWNSVLAVIWIEGWIRHLLGLLKSEIFFFFFVLLWVGSKSDSTITSKYHSLSAGGLPEWRVKCPASTDSYQCTGVPIKCVKNTLHPVFFALCQMLMYAPVYMHSTRRSLLALWVCTQPLLSVGV